MYQEQDYKAALKSFVEYKKLKGDTLKVNSLIDACQQQIKQ